MTTNILRKNKNTKQILLVKKLIKYFSSNNNIKGVVIRGSIAKGTSDRSSDVDLLLITKNNKFISTINSLNKLLASQVELLGEDGWVDKIVPNFGGIGFVYMCKFEGKLIQLDVYVLPEENSERISKFKDKYFVYKKGELKYKKGVNYEKHNFNKELDKFILSRSEKFQIFFEVMLMYEMLLKHILRKDVFLAYKYRYHAHEKLLYLLRYILDPVTRNYYFYDVNRHLGKYNSSELHIIENIIKESEDIFSINKLLKDYKFYENLTKKYLPDTYKDNYKLIKEVKNYIKINIISK